MAPRPRPHRPRGAPLTGDALPATLSLPGRDVGLRRATADDLPALVALLADDPLGAARERTDGDLSAYRRAFARVDGDPAHVLLVAEQGETVVGTLQLTLVPGLSRGGALRGQIEAVRVAADVRGAGLGAAMVGWAVDEARRQGATLVQLTTDKERADARRFYERLGFVASHEGLKLQLPASS